MVQWWYIFLMMILFTISESNLHSDSSSTDDNLGMIAMWRWRCYQVLRETKPEVVDRPFCVAETLVMPLGALAQLQRRSHQWWALLPLVPGQNSGTLKFPMNQWSVTWHDPSPWLTQAIAKAGLSLGEYTAIVAAGVSCLGSGGCLCERI